MNAPFSFSARIYRFGSVRLLALACSTCAVALSGCGSNGSHTPGGPPAQSGNTTVVLMLTSTGNDRITSFNGTLNSLTLMSQSGKTVNVFPSSPYQTSPEFHHLNGTTEPFMILTVPEDTYTSATLTMGYTQFACTSYVSGANGGLNNEVFADQTVPSNRITVTLPKPLTINQPTGLALDLQEAASATFPTCTPNSVSTYSIAPIFHLQQLPFGQLPTNLADGEATTLVGTVSSVASDGASFTITLPDGPTLTVGVSASATVQGVNSVSDLNAGEAVDIDIDFNPDASISASRVEVLDADATTLTTALGPVVFISDAEPSLFMIATQAQGTLAGSFPNGNSLPFSFGLASFRIYGGYSILHQLPFTPTFTATSMVPGQNIFFTTHAKAIAEGPLYLPATTATLMPQTVDAIVTRVQTSGMLTSYNVTLAAYDLFPDLAVQPGQNSSITSPGTMTIYTYNGNDGLQAGSVTVGQPFRFTGLVFNDNGSLRMACSQILAGVAP